MRTLVSLLALTLAAPALAQEALPPGLAGVEVRQGWRTPDGGRVAALHIALEDGWKTYWRVPGEAGVPPMLDFSHSANVAAVQVVWPAPEVFDQDGLRSVGYLNELVLPLEITPADPAAPVQLDADLDIGICHDICVPVQLEVKADLAGPGGPDAKISAALGAEPAPRPGLARCTVEPVRDGVRVNAAIDLPQASGEVALFELRSTPMWVSETEMGREGAVLMASAEFVPDAGKPFALDQNDLRITVLSAAGAIEIDGCPAN